MIRAFRLYDHTWAKYFTDIQSIRWALNMPIFSYLFSLSYTFLGVRQILLHEALKSTSLLVWYVSLSLVLHCLFKHTGILVMKKPIDKYELLKIIVTSGINCSWNYLLRFTDNIYQVIALSHHWLRQSFATHKRQAITWNNTDSLSISQWDPHSGEIWIKVQGFFFQ